MCRPGRLRIQNLFRGAELRPGTEERNGKPLRTRSLAGSPHLFDGDYDPEGEWGKSGRGPRQDILCYQGAISLEASGTSAYGPGTPDRMGAHPSAFGARTRFVFCKSGDVERLVEGSTGH